MSHCKLPATAAVWRSFTPLLTRAWMALLAPVIDSIESEPLNQLSILGAAIVVGASVLMSLAGRNAKLRQQFRTQTSSVGVTPSPPKNPPD